MLLIFQKKKIVVLNPNQPTNIWNKKTHMKENVNRTKSNINKNKIVKHGTISYLYHCHTQKIYRKIIQKYDSFIIATIY